MGWLTNLQPQNLHPVLRVIMVIGLTTNLLEMLSPKSPKPERSES